MDINIPRSADLAKIRLILIINVDRNKLDGISRRHFVAATGMEPVDDDLERSNCTKAGQMGHWQCGWDPLHNLPRFMTGNYVPRDK